MSGEVGTTGLCLYRLFPVRSKRWTKLNIVQSKQGYGCDDIFGTVNLLLKAALVGSGYFYLRVGRFNMGDEMV